jgi:hypothetical protein
MPPTAGQRAIKFDLGNDLDQLSMCNFAIGIILGFVNAIKNLPGISSTPVLGEPSWGFWERD